MQLPQHDLHIAKAAFAELLLGGGVFLVHVQPICTHQQNIGGI